MTDVVERLEGLSDGPAGDWLDVMRRCEQHRAARFKRRVLLIAAAVVLLAVPAIAVAQRVSEALSVSPGETDVDVAYIAGNKVRNLGGRDFTLTNAVWLHSSFGYDLARAIPSPDNKQLVYHALDVASPMRATGLLRIADLETGEDRLIGRGIYSAAWRADGALAYTQGPVPRQRIAACCSAEEPELGHVYVRARPESPPVQWTRRPSNYEVFAWAGEKLLVGARVASEGTVRRRFGIPQENPGVYALEGPGRVRLLPLAAVTAVDPSGRYAIGPTTLGLNPPAEATLRVVRVSDGSVLGEQPLAPLATPDQPYAEFGAVSGGSWAGDYIVVGYSGLGWADPASESSNDAIVVLEFDGGLRPTHVFRVDRASAGQAGLAAGAWSVSSPRFTDEEGRKIVALGATVRGDPVTNVRGQPQPSGVLLLCDRVEKTCRRSGELERDRYGIGFVENPSRPLPSSGG